MVQGSKVVADEWIGVGPGAGLVELPAAGLQEHGLDKVGAADADVGGNVLLQVQAAQES